MFKFVKDVAVNTIFNIFLYFLNYNFTNKSTNFNLFFISLILCFTKKEQYGHANDPIEL